MDRNDSWTSTHYADYSVATREGGVDRNTRDGVNEDGKTASPPARVAWIETLQFLCRIIYNIKSPPARVAWIETVVGPEVGRGGEAVATREGGVDRNIALIITRCRAACRHPRGWRG